MSMSTLHDKVVKILNLITNVDRFKKVGVEKTKYVDSDTSEVVGESYDAILYKLNYDEEIDSFSLMFKIGAKYLSTLTLTNQLRSVDVGIYFYLVNLFIDITYFKINRTVKEELCQEYNISISTVNNAISRLKKVQLIVENPDHRNIYSFNINFIYKGHSDERNKKLALRGPFAKNQGLNIKNKID